LNSQLNREVAEYEASVKEGTHSLRGTAYDVDSSNYDEDQGGGAYVLGGGPSGSVVPATPGNAAERRAKIIEAAMKRLQEHEAEMESKCAN
jgi:hypothetical protein